MDENKSITYDDLIQTRNTQILKSIVPYLDVPAQKPLAMLIQLMEWKNATAAFSRQENSMAACSLPAGTKLQYDAHQLEFHWDGDKAHKMARAVKPKWVS